jgi:hypothetical protein
MIYYEIKEGAKLIQGHDDRKETEAAIIYI